jgi:hypothetical protein
MHVQSISRDVETIRLEKYPVIFNCFSIMICMYHRTKLKIFSVKTNMTDSVNNYDNILNIYEANIIPL